MISMVFCNTQIKQISHQWLLIEYQVFDKIHAVVQTCSSHWVILWLKCIPEHKWTPMLTFKVYIQYISRNMHTVFALLCFVVVIHWLIFPYSSGLLHWHSGNLTIAPVPAKRPWWIRINTSCEFIRNDCITTAKRSTTKPCAYFLGYTVSFVNELLPIVIGFGNYKTQAIKHLSVPWLSFSRVPISYIW